MEKVHSLMVVSIVRCKANETAKEQVIAYLGVPVIWWKWVKTSSINQFSVPGVSVF